MTQTAAAPWPEQDGHRLDPLNEVIPGRLWQSGSWIRREHAEKFDVVLSVGNARQRWEPDWMEAGWRAVRPKEGMVRLPVFIHAPLIDARKCLDAQTAEATARYALNLYDMGRRLLIHCDAGAFRSVFMTALVLAAVEGIGGIEACARVDRIRGRAPGRERVGIGIPEFDAMLRNWNPQRRAA
jgi:hypothetical protein